MARVVERLRADHVRTQRLDHILSSQLHETQREKAHDVEVALHAFRLQNVREVADGVVRTVAGVVFGVEVEDGPRLGLRAGGQKTRRTGN